jgi:hypothetical protein
MPINPKLGPLAENGGPTQTMALLSGSPAIDAGTASVAPATDQRGVSRESPPDIGAYEFIPAAGSRANGSRAARGARGIDTPRPILCRAQRAMAGTARVSWIPSRSTW